MKRIKIIVCYILALALLLCGCGDDSGSKKTQSSTTTTQHTTSASTHITGGGSTTAAQSGSNTNNTTNVVGTTGITGGSTTQTQPPEPSCSHVDSNSDDICDQCHSSVIVYFNLYSVNDLHGKFADDGSNIGVDELTTYLKNARQTEDNAFFLSAGDMWQGSAESNMTKGKILVDWMNELDFVAMALGNHEFDWGEEYIEENAAFAEFPFIAINVYDRDTNQLVDYCAPSVMIEGDGLQIGIIGAIGDCYSSIAVDKCDEVYFKTGRELTDLVKAESDRLRREGADFIVYVIHDGYGRSSSGQLGNSQFASYYDTSLSDGYVDLVFEGHTHQGYRVQDMYGVHHLQNRGDNKGGISHAKIAINAITMESNVIVAETVSTYVYQNLEDDPIVAQLLQKYEDLISPANRVLGYNSYFRNEDALLNVVAQLYYETAVEEWGDQYQIVLGGGYMSTRSPYNLYAGEVTYGDLQTILPFDNQLTLCSIKGSYLISKFLETNNGNYYIYCGEYGNSIRDNIDRTATYYLVTDSYTAYYGPNHLTVVEEYDPNVFARDLLADYIEAGKMS